MSKTVGGPAERTTITVRLPVGWAKAALVGILAPIIGWVVPVIVSMVGFWSVADNPWLKERGWQEAVTTGSKIWTLSLGSPANLDGLQITLVPLLWTIAQIIILRLLLRVTRKNSRFAAWAAIPTFIVTSVLMLTAIGPGGSYLRLSVGAFLVSALAAAWAFGAARKHPWLRGAQKVSVLWFAALLVVPFVALAIRWAQTWGEMGQMTEELGAVGLGAVILALVQLIFTPNALFWALSWVSGAGFTGVGGQLITPQSPAEVEVPLPIWALVPTEPSTLHWPPLLIALGVAVGIVTCWVWREMKWSQATAQSALAGVFLLGAVAVATAVSRGGLGVDRLANLGPTVWATVGAVALLMLLPLLAIVIGFNPSGLRWLWQRLSETARKLQLWWGVNPGVPRRVFAQRWGLAGPERAAAPKDDAPPKVQVPVDAVAKPVTPRELPRTVRPSAVPMRGTVETINEGAPATDIPLRTAPPAFLRVDRRGAEGEGREGD